VFCKCCSLGLTKCCWITNCIAKNVVAYITKTLQRLCRYVWRTFVNFKCNQIVQKILLCAMKQLFTPNIFWKKKSCSLGLAGWFAPKRRNSTRFWSICMKFSILMCFSALKSNFLTLTFTGLPVSIGCFDWQHTQHSGI